MSPHFSFFFFFNYTATTYIYTLSLHYPLPICHGFETATVPVSLKGLEGSADVTVLALRVVVARAELLVGAPGGQQQVCRGEHLVGDGHNGLFVSGAPHQAAIAAGQRTVADVDGRQRGFDEGGPQPAIALPGAHGPALPRTLVSAGA